MLPSFIEMSLLYKCKIRIGFKLLLLYALSIKNPNLEINFIDSLCLLVLIFKFFVTSIQQVMSRQNRDHIFFQIKQ